MPMKDLPIIKIKISEVELAPWNYKEDSEILKVKLMNAMEKNGYIDKIAVAEREEQRGVKEIVNGNHRVMAFRDKGITEIQAIDLGILKKTQRMRVGAELNEIRFDTDKTKLAELIVDIKADFGVQDLVLTTPFNEDDFKEFDQIMNTASNNPESKEPKDKGVDEDWVYFKLGDIKGNVPKSVYALFQSCIAKLKMNDVDKLPNQLECICAEFISTHGTGNDATKE